MTSTQSTDLRYRQDRSLSDGGDMDSLEVISDEKGPNIKGREGQAGTALYHYRDLGDDRPAGVEDGDGDGGGEP